MRPVPAKPYVAADRHLRHVGKDCVVAFEANLYSLPAARVFHRQLARVRASAGTISLHATVPDEHGVTLFGRASRGRSAAATACQFSDLCPQLHHLPPQLLDLRVPLPEQLPQPALATRDAAKSPGAGAAYGHMADFTRASVGNQGDTPSRLNEDRCTRSAADIQTYPVTTGQTPQEAIPCACRIEWIHDHQRQERVVRLFDHQNNLYCENVF